MKKVKELELTSEMLDRNDRIDNAVQDCITILAEKEVPWNMEIIGKITDAMISIELAKVATI